MDGSALGLQSEAEQEQRQLEMGQKIWRDNQGCSKTQESPSEQLTGPFSSLFVQKPEQGKTLFPGIAWACAGREEGVNQPTKRRCDGDK